MPPEMPFTPEQPKQPLYSLTVHIDMDSFHKTILDRITRQVDRPKEDHPQPISLDPGLQEIHDTLHESNNWPEDPVIINGSADISTDFSIKKGDSATLFCELELSTSSLEDLLQQYQTYTDAITHQLESSFEIRINLLDQQDSEEIINYENHITMHFKSKIDPNAPEINCILPIYWDNETFQLDTENPTINVELTWDAVRLQQEQYVKQDLGDARTILDTLYTQLYAICHYNPPVRNIEPRYL